MASLGNGHIQLRALTLMTDGKQRTAREIAEAIGYTRQQVYQAVNALHLRDFAIRHSHGPRNPRTYEISSQGRDLISGKVTHV